jgi:hypothetical protein
VRDEVPSSYVGVRALLNRWAAKLTPFIEVVRHPYEEPYHVNLVVTASNGAQSAGLEIYANAADLSTFARALREVPDRAPEAVWELGSERPEDNFAFYFRLRAHQTSKTGQWAVEVRLNNNLLPPARMSSEFSITAVPADLDRLAALFEQFGHLEHRKLRWCVTSGELQV